MKRGSIFEFKDTNGQIVLTLLKKRNIFILNDPEGDYEYEIDMPDAIGLLNFLKDNIKTNKSHDEHPQRI